MPVDNTGSLLRDRPNLDAYVSATVSTRKTEPASVDQYPDTPLVGGTEGAYCP